MPSACLSRPTTRRPRKRSRRSCGSIPTTRSPATRNIGWAKPIYARGRYADAASAFAEGYKRYPKSPKAAGDLLKLGVSLARGNQNKNACVPLSQLDHDLPACGEHAEGAGGEGEEASGVLTSGLAVAPLGVAEFGAAFEALARFEARPFIAVAVSGGPDSLALTILADRWARARGGHICALSVDHGLRPESGGEIARLRDWLAARAIRHQVLVWSGDKPATRIQERAREARYRLLDEWCRDNGCLHLLTAHHREDQAETHLIRARAGSGADGLAAMPAVRELGSCRILRPLLGFDKARLAALLAAEGQPFIDDPSNRNPVFERARLRGRDCAAPAGLAERIRALGRARASRERMRDMQLAQAVRIHPAGFAAIEAGPFRALPSAIAEAALAALARTIGGGAYPVRAAGVARLHDRLADVSFSGYTLGGCRFVRWRKWVLVLREPAAAQAPVGLSPGTAVGWDRRYRFSLGATAPGPVTVGCLGQARSLGLDCRIGRSQRGDLPRLVHSALPAAWNQTEVIGVPHLGYRGRPPAVLPEVELVPVISPSSPGFAVV